MGKRASKKKHKRGTSKFEAVDRTIAPEFFVLENPFDRLSDTQRRQAIKEFAENNMKEYQESLSELRKLLRQHDPLLVLSQLTYYGLFDTVDKVTGVTRLDSDHLIHQFHIEILQALVLQTKPEELSSEPCNAAVVQRILDHVMTLCSTVNFRQLNTAGSELPHDEKSIALAQQLMRSTTQATRNWGYHSQVKKIARELYGPFDTQLVDARGFSVSEIVNVFEKIIAEIEARQSIHAKTLSTLFTSCKRDRNLLIRTYHDLIGLDRQKADRLIKQVEEEQIPLEGVRSIVAWHYDMALPDINTIFALDLANSLNIDAVRVIAILDEYSHEWGSLHECETEHFHLSNPVWQKPLVKLGNNKYFCSLAIVFFSFVIPCIEAVLSPFKDKVSSCRADYLEYKVAEIVKRRFPDSGLKQNLKWTEDGTTYETDLIVVIDSFMLIVECKSGKLTPSALRGAPPRLRRHIKELVIEPNLQSMQLKNRVASLNARPNSADPLSKEIGNDLSKIHKVVRVSVSLEDFGPIQSSLKQLADTGWVPAEFTPCPTMNLADFETVFDLLEHPVQILHYLMKREQFEATVDYLGHELDLLGLYLTTLLDFSNVAPKVTYTYIGMSAPLDSYYDSLDAGVRIEKPRPAISPLFASIFSQLETRGFDRWTEMGVALSMFSPDDQRKISQLLTKLEFQVHENWNTEGHQNRLICVPSHPSSYAMGYVMFKNENANKRREFMEQAANEALESNHVRTVIVIGRNIDVQDAAYHTIALVERRRGSTE